MQGAVHVLMKKRTVACPLRERTENLPFSIQRFSVFIFLKLPKQSAVMLRRTSELKRCVDFVGTSHDILSSSTTDVNMGLVRRRIHFKKL